MNGKKTYLVAGLMALVTFAWKMQWIDDKSYEALLAFLGAGGLAALRHGVSRSGGAAAIAAFMLTVTALPANAQIAQLAVGWGSHTIDKNGVFQDATAKEPQLKLEGQFPVKSLWAGLQVGYGTKTDSKSMAIRLYAGDDSTATYPGIGIGVHRWDREDFPELLTTDTMLLGPEVLLEFLVPDGFPVVAGERALAWIGYYTRVQGDQGVSELGFGIDYLTDLGGS